MTSPSRRKRPTTVRAPITPAPTRAEFAAALLLALASLARAQEPQPPINVPVGAQVPPAVRLSHQDVTPVYYQQPGGIYGRTPRGGVEGEEKPPTVKIQLEPPGKERLLLSMTSDADLQERIRQENYKEEPDQRITFPEVPILSRDRYYGRGGIWPRRALVVEPNFTNYNKLYFEDKNAERYGWELGPLQPFISPLLFYFDVAWLPVRCLADPCNKMESNAGYCLPGDPVPYRIYPLDITPQGIAGELAAITALIVIFP